jgi:hypothetical protein
MLISWLRRPDLLGNSHMLQKSREPRLAGAVRYGVLRGPGLGFLPSRCHWAALLVVVDPESPNLKLPRVAWYFPLSLSHWGAEGNNIKEVDSLGNRPVGNR